MEWTIRLAAIAQLRHVSLYLMRFRAFSNNTAGSAPDAIVDGNVSIIEKMELSIRSSNLAYPGYNLIRLD